MVLQSDPCIKENISKIMLKIVLEQYIVELESAITQIGPQALLASCNNRKIS